MKIKQNKLSFLILLISIFIMPLSVSAYTDKVYVGGENIGIEVNSKGVLVVGFYEVNKKSPGRDAGLKVGDVITYIDGQAIEGIDELSEVINQNLETINIKYIRSNKEYKTSLNLIKENEVFKTGLYVKDTIIGIGTLTFIDSKTNIYGALGHQIIESSSGLKFEIKDGKIFKSTVTSIDKSRANSPGEKNADYSITDVYGTIFKNEITGIYGRFNKNIGNKELLPVANNDEIKEGNAIIRTVINNELIEEFNINILKINKEDPTKNILFEVTDKVLLEKTNGIVQGMSGSPIIQNGKIIGAVTHVVVDNPKKGYGIFINNMLKDAKEKSD